MDETDQIQEPQPGVGVPSQKNQSRYTGEEAQKLGKVYAIVLKVLDARDASGDSGGGSGASERTRGGSPA